MPSSLSRGTRQYNSGEQKLKKGIPDEAPTIASARMFSPRHVFGFFPVISATGICEIA
jgi:hypothetical protein